MGIRDRVRRLLDRVRRVERRELAEFTAWLETTTNFVHLTGLVAVPVLIVLVTAASNSVNLLPFVLFPPLASGTFTLFSDPEGQYADPWRFTLGLTVGALCGSLAVVAAIATGLTTPGAREILSVVSPLAAGFAVFLTAAVTWAFDIEEPSAFSTALLALLIPTAASAPYRPLALYVIFTAAASGTVAGAFVFWRDTVYERRADILYRSTESANRVLVPSLGDETTVTAMLAGRIAGETGTVVLADVVDSETVAAAERDLLQDSAPSAAAAPDDAATRQDAVSVGLDTPETDERDPAAVAAPSAARLEGLAERVTATTGAQCEQVVATGDVPAEVIDATALELDCDLIATAYEGTDGQLSPFITSLFRGSVDVLAHEPVDRHRNEWATVLVPVRRASDVAHEMLAFAGRLAGPGGVTLATCIGPEGDRRRAESMLANLAETCEFDVETRVSRLEVEPFIERTAPRFDLVLMGASRDRSTASRIVSPPTFERVGELETDMAVVDRNVRY